MVGQGVTAKHSQEHLVTSDKGIVMLRRLLQAQLQAVAERRDPAGVSFDPEAPSVVFTAAQRVELCVTCGVANSLAGA